MSCDDARCQHCGIYAECIKVGRYWVCHACGVILENVAADMARQAELTARQNQRQQLVRQVREWRQLDLFTR